MSAIAENLRRQRYPLLTIAALAVLAAGIWIMLFQARAADHNTQSDLPVAAPAVEQAPWKIQFSAEGRFGKLSKAQRESYANQKENVAAVVTGIYDAIFIEPAKLDEAIEATFSRDAARSLAAKDLSFPTGATEVTTTRRRASIGLAADNADFAVGKVTVFAEATIGERQVDVEHHSTLWLERADGDWKVIAFDVKQGPAR